MRPKLLVIAIWFAVTGSFAFAQDEKTEVAAFGGGYFNSGFQSFKVLNPTTGAQVGTFKPVSEANSGIFGVRSSYSFRSQMAAEATFGFSPAGRTQNSSWCRIQGISSAWTGREDGFPRSHQQIRSEHSE